MKLIKKITMENTEDGHNKVWIGHLFDNDLVVTEWGKIGYPTQNKSFPGAGEDFLNKKVLEKEKKGYSILAFLLSKI